MSFSCLLLLVEIGSILLQNLTFLDTVYSLHVTKSIHDTSEWIYYRLDGPGIESLCEEKFSAPVQTGPGAHPASCTMGTGSFPE